MVRRDSQAGASGSGSETNLSVWPSLMRLDGGGRGANTRGPGLSDGGFTAANVLKIGRPVLSARALRGIDDGQVVTIGSVQIGTGDSERVDRVGAAVVGRLGCRDHHDSCSNGNKD